MVSIFCGAQRPKPGFFQTRRAGIFVEPPTQRQKLRRRDITGKVAGMDERGKGRLKFLAREEREGGEVRRTGVFVEPAMQIYQAPSKSDIIGNGAGICRPDGAVSLAHWMGEMPSRGSAGRRPGDGFDFGILQICRA